MIEIPVSPLVATIIVLAIVYVLYKVFYFRGYEDGVHDGSIITVDLLRKNGYIGKDTVIEIKQDINEDDYK